MLLCALALLTSPVVCPPPEPGLLDRVAEARPPFAHLEPRDDEPAAPVRTDAPAAQDPEPARDDPPDPAYNPVEKPEAPGRYGVGEPWATLAECESGNWVDGGRSFEAGSARWGWGGPDPVPPWGTAVHDGGLQFHPDTWAWLAPAGYPARAYDASPAQQVAVAEEVLARQGWEAWPVCSSKVGLR